MTAASEAEIVARRLGARDFRALVNAGGRSMRPIDPQLKGRHTPFLLWVAVDQHGYWGTASIPDAGPGDAADTVIEAMVAAVRPGVTCGDIAARALSAMPPEARELALSYGLGGGIGLDLDGGPQIEPGSDRALVEGMVLSLRAFVVDSPSAFATRTIRVTAEGNQWLIAP